MPKSLWECAKEGCGEKAIVPEGIIPNGWYKIDLVHRCSESPNPEKYVEEFQSESQEEDEGPYECVVYDSIEACCSEHAIQITKETIEEMIPVSESEDE